MNCSEPLVIVVEDDDEVRSALAMMLQAVGIRVRAFSTAEDFLGNLSSVESVGPRCLILDVRLPGMSGLDLQLSINNLQPGLPTLILTGCADVPTAVHALKAGAFDFLEKPLNRGLLLQRIRNALELNARTNIEAVQERAMEMKINTLTTREREVLQLMLNGLKNKQIASTLGISIQTAAKHSVRILEKLDVDNVIQLAKAGRFLFSSPSQPQNGFL